ncbi:unnamed protein product [Candidula unifasciata]|uniref:Peptide chain release factor domain-containing protein n=1 Tax=Candidula unifasciata TaxID=100452 RepID=A0A8S4A854_9EUPU|nr:unnamed protein product [Candidula unifasciata]
MAVAASLDRHICVLFRRCITSLPAVCSSASLNVTVPQTSGQAAKSLTANRASRILLCPTVPQTSGQAAKSLTANRASRILLCPTVPQTSGQAAKSLTANRASRILLCPTVPYTSGQAAKGLTANRASRILLCPRLFSLCSFKCTFHKCCSVELQNPHCGHYPTYLHRLYQPHTFYRFHFNLDLTITSLLTGTITRGYHGSSKFTIKNPLYASYLDSLVEEYNLLSESQSSSHNTQLTKHQALRFRFLRPVVETIKRIQEKQSEAQELASAIQGETDKDMRKMMETEIEKYHEIIEELEEELVGVLVGKEPADHNDIILEVSAGVGGQEAMLFAAEILDMYCNYAHFKGWTITGLSAEKSEIGGIRRGTVEITGQDVYKHMKYEAGVHRVQRVPKTEKAGRIHTSTISVTVLPQPREIDIDIQQKDLKLETFRGSGPGGQSVNTTDSAVRITHIPTGTVSECRQERSQIKNKELAMKNLKNKMYQVILEEEVAQRRAVLKMQAGSLSRSEKIRTYNFQQDRITDHRVKESLSDLTVFMTGNERLDDLISVLAENDRIQVLEAMLEAYETEHFKKQSGKS